MGGRCSECNSGAENGVETGVGCQELMADSPRGSPRRDVVYSVRAGSPWIDQMVQTTSDVPVSQVIVNSKFQSRRYWSWIGQDNDIALLKLEGALKYSKYIGPICLPGLDYVMKDQSLCTVTGWGRPRADGEWEPPRTRVGGTGEDWVQAESTMDRCF